jgi:hypothetical protein
MKSTTGFEEYTITPAIAERLSQEHREASVKGRVAGRHANRRHAKTQSERYADLMRSGLFYTTGDRFAGLAHLKFTSPLNAELHGRDLIDGQHTLAAIITSKTTQRLAVARGCCPEAMHAIDSGRQRTLRDVFDINRKDHSGWLAAATAWLFRHNRGVFTSRKAPGHAESIEVLKAHPGLQDACKRIAEVYRKGILSPGISAFLLYVYGQGNAKIADRFFEILYTGNYAGRTVRADDPAVVLRDVLVTNFSKATKLRETSKLGLTAKALNAAFRGQPIGRLTWKKGEAMPKFRI